MGREKIKLQLVCFFTNWKAEETTSTFNDEGLKWNFNIANKLGVGFHQYSLPGYPSHSCLRLQERDAATYMIGQINGCLLMLKR
jgi:hypothetical protein